MDIQLIIIAAIVVIIALILLAFFVFGTRERTFEDALAQQKGLGILLSDKNQTGKAADRHKDKAKIHDGGGGKKKVKHVDSTGTGPIIRKKGKPTDATEPGTANAAPSISTDDKQVQKRTSASSSVDTKLPEEQEKQSPKETVVTSRHSESSRSRQSSHSGGTGINVDESKLKKKQQNGVPETEAVNEPRDSGAVEQKKAGKKNTKHRRADLDSVDAAAHGNGDYQVPIKEQDVVENGSDNLPAKEIIIGGENQPVSDNVEVQQALKKGHKKKHKAAVSSRLDQDAVNHLNKEDKENASGDHVSHKHITSSEEAVVKEDKTVQPAITSNLGEQVDSIIDKVKPSLNNAQLELVVDALLAKQETRNKNVTKDDQQVARLKKQLEDKEKALTQETQLVASVNHKLKELKQQLDAEKNRSAASERTYVDQLNVKQRELQTTQQKVQELNGQCAQLSAQGRHAQEQLLSYRKMLEQAPNPTQVKQLRDENHLLKDRITRIEQESHAFGADIQRLRQEVSQRDNQLHQAEQRLVQLQQTLTVQEKSQAQQLTEYQQKLASKDAAYGQLEQELANVRREWALLETSVHELRQQASLVTQQPPLEQNITLQKTHAAPIDGESSMHGRLADLNKKLDESQAVLKRQDNQHQKELQHLRDQLENAKRERAKLEAEFAAENKRLQSVAKSVSEKVDMLEKSETNARNQLETEKKARSHAEAELKKSERDSKSKNGPDAKDANSGPALEASQRRLAELDETSKKLEGELEKMKQDRQELEQKLQTVLQENTKLKEQAAIASTNGHFEGASADALKIQELSLTHLNKQLITKDGEIAELKQQLGQQREKNTELRERNQKVVEAMNQLEKTSKTVTEKIEKKYQKELDEQEKQVKSAFSGLIPSAKIPGSLSFFEWIKEVQRIVAEKPKQQTVEKPHSADVELQKRSKETDTLIRENMDLRSKINHYQLALQQTETALNQIEDVTAKHEREWRERVSNLEKQVEKTGSGGHHVDLTSGGVKHVKDDESKIASLRKTLEAAEKERSSYKEELEQIRRDIERERDSVRDLSSQVVKLRGMLKTGQDALKQEQDLVTQLQKQLKAFQEGKGEHQLHDELNELQTKLVQREQQLEREMSINKQLNNKLASFGVSSPPAAIVGNSNGTL